MLSTMSANLARISSLSPVRGGAFPGREAGRGLAFWDRERELPVAEWVEVVVLPAAKWVEVVVIPVAGTVAAGYTAPLDSLLHMVSRNESKYSRYREADSDNVDIP
jgi:hypothetical protein